MIWALCEHCGSVAAVASASELVDWDPCEHCGFIAWKPQACDHDWLLWNRMGDIRVWNCLHCHAKLSTHSDAIPVVK